MKKILIAAAALAFTAAPAMAAEFGLVIGAGGSQSSSAAGAASAGASVSTGNGSTAQISGVRSNSNGAAEQVISGNDSGAQSTHTSSVVQGGTTTSFGRAASINGNLGAANGSSAAGNRLAGVWLFANN